MWRVVTLSLVQASYQTPRRSNSRVQLHGQQRPLRALLEPSWATALGSTIDSPAFAALEAFLREERDCGIVYPPEDRTFAAFHNTPFESVRVVILGQDPYHGPCQAHGLAFSVPGGVPPPPSLRNILGEVQRDLGLREAGHVPSGDLTPWARDGVLLLNSILTVRAGSPLSHAGRGWESFTDAAIRALSARRRGLVFLLWGARARAKAAFIDGSKHHVLQCAHPSPLSAHRGFNGCAHFSRANQLLTGGGVAPIAWGSVFGPTTTEHAPSTATGTTGSPAPVPEKNAQAREQPKPITPLDAGEQPGLTWRAQVETMKGMVDSGHVAAYPALVLPDETAPAAVVRFQRLVALVLSAQALDPAVERAFHALTAACDGTVSVEAVVGMGEVGVQRVLLGVPDLTAPRRKAKYLLELAVALEDMHGGDVPLDLKALEKLPGVGPWTATTCIHLSTGSAPRMAVDSKVLRVASRLGWCTTDATAAAARRELEALIPRAEWGRVHDALQRFSRAVCAWEPHCSECPIGERGGCPYAASPPREFPGGEYLPHPPSTSQLMKALKLAGAHRLDVPYVALSDREACARFIASASLQREPDTPGRHSHFRDRPE